MSKADKEYWILEFGDGKYMIFSSKKACKKQTKKVKGSTKARQIIGVQALQEYQQNAYDAKHKKAKKLQIDGPDVLSNDTDDIAKTIPIDTVSEELEEQDQPNSQVNDGKKGMMFAFVDGSYNEAIKTCGFSCVYISAYSVQHCSGTLCDPDAVKLRNVAGELMAVIQAVNYAVFNDYSEINIVHDFIGDEDLIDSKNNNPFIQRYGAWMKEQKKNIKISFTHVEAHSGNKFNNIADKLAKNATAAVI